MRSKNATFALFSPQPKKKILDQVPRGPHQGAAVPGHRRDHRLRRRHHQGDRQDRKGLKTSHTTSSSRKRASRKRKRERAKTVISLALPLEPTLVPGLRRIGPNGHLRRPLLEIWNLLSSSQRPPVKKSQRRNKSFFWRKMFFGQSQKKFFLKRRRKKNSARDSIFFASLQKIDFVSLELKLFFANEISKSID